VIRKGRKPTPKIIIERLKAVSKKQELFLMGPLTSRGEVLPNHDPGEYYGEEMV
jgi:hypothetical protein